ncbi:MAG: DUF5717 family protein [Defluviitaleaceae bacterium]|nr:DUF5717 family protein [Defluviitaleaceae bacterium]
MLTNIISKLEKRLAHKPTPQTAATFAIRNWQAVKFMGGSGDFADSLQKANQAIMAAHRQNPSDIKIYCLAIFINIEAGHLDTANDMLDKAMEYKKFLAGHDPFYYSILCFLYTYLEICQNRIQSAIKRWRIFNDHSRSNPSTPHNQVMQGLLHLAVNEYAEAYKYLSDAYIIGTNSFCSVFLYEGLYRYYKEVDYFPEDDIVIPVLTYAANRGAETIDIAEAHEETILASANNFTAAERLYKASNWSPLLKTICQQLIKEVDLSPKAYNYYKEAESRQVFSKGLYEVLVRAAHHNKDENINHYPMVEFFIPYKTRELEDDVALYVYHTLLTSPKLEDMVFTQQNKILRLAEKLLRRGVGGREAASLYHHLWTRHRLLGRSGEELAAAERFLQANLTVFQIELQPGSEIRHIYISQPEKRGMTLYQPGEGQLKVLVEAASPDFSCICLDHGNKTVLDEPLKIRRMVEKADPALFLYFFQKGDRRFYVLSYLANYFLRQDKPPETAIDVFEAILEAKNLIDASYAMRILVALGKLYYNSGNLTKALECYSQIDHLDDEFVEQALNAYLQTNAFDLAADLLEKRHRHIGSKTLYQAVIQLSPLPINKTPLAVIAYQLLLEGYHDPQLLELVLASLDASYAELSTLYLAMEGYSKAPEAMEAFSAHLLEYAMWLGQWDTAIQKAAVTLHGSFDHRELVERFIDYATFQMLANNSRPEHDMLTLLEKWYLEKDPDNSLLAFGIAGVCLAHGINTFNSDKILKKSITMQEREGILLPIFKEKRPEPVPYIEKHQPFEYRSAPGKDCKLYYRIDNAINFTMLPMKYLNYGIYTAKIPLFYNEEVTYYFSEEMPSGSITTTELTAKSTVPFQHESNDPFFAINNAVISSKMFKDDQTEKTLSGLAKHIQHARSTLL